MEPSCLLARICLVERRSAIFEIHKIQFCIQSWAKTLEDPAIDFDSFIRVSPRHTSQILIILISQLSQQCIRVDLVDLILIPVLRRRKFFRCWSPCFVWMEMRGICIQWMNHHHPSITTTIRENRKDGNIRWFYDLNLCEFVSDCSCFSSLHGNSFLFFLLSVQFWFWCGKQKAASAHQYQSCVDATILRKGGRTKTIP